MLPGGRVGWGASHGADFRRGRKRQAAGVTLQAAAAAHVAAGRKQWKTCRVSALENELRGGRGVTEGLGRAEGLLAEVPAFRLDAVV